jgi:threonine dehydratase
MDVRTEVLWAERRIRAHVRETPLEHSLRVSEITKCSTFLKLENLQYTGSFKIRGAMNKLLSLTPEQRARGVVAASSGNHGAAVAFGLSRLNMKGIIFVPERTSPTKLEAIRSYGPEVRFHGSDCAVTEVYARNYAERNGMVYISPYNDPQVIGGQGTIAVELTRQLDRIDAVFVSVGGGGMISGIAGYLKSVSADVTVIGCSPENSPVMARSVKANRILEMESKPTLSDGTAGGIEPGAITFSLCQTLVDDYVLVSENEIREAMLLFMETHHMLIEGAAGVAIASYLKTKDRFRGKNVVVVICGANISLETLKTIL